MDRIKVTDVKGFKIGSTEDPVGATGVTAIICEKGAVAGVAVRGGGPATRETDLLKPENMVQQIHAVTLSGGSAYGLESGSGVMNYLEEKGVGFDVGVGLVPIVCGASLFDLVVGDFKARPNREMGYQAAANAYQAKYRDGNYGAGTGATVGKYRGVSRMMKSGQGSSAVQLGELQIGAIVAVNALGDVFDRDGKQIAGMLSEDGSSLLSTSEEIKSDISNQFDVFKGNTTISCIITNGKLTKAECTKIASIAHDGYARVIKPVHSSADGDTIFVMATGEVDVNFDALGVLATEQIEKAIVNAVQSAEPAYGLKTASQFGEKD